MGLPRGLRGQGCLGIGWVEPEDEEAGGTGRAWPEDEGQLGRRGLQLRFLNSLPVKVSAGLVSEAWLFGLCAGNITNIEKP